MEWLVSIGRVKRDISELVNRVAFGGGRVVLTSRGKPKAVIISMGDYERLKRQEAALGSWDAWMADSKRLSDGIRQRLLDQPIDVESIWSEARSDLEERDGRLLSR